MSKTFATFVWMIKIYFMTKAKTTSKSSSVSKARSAKQASM